MKILIAIPCYNEGENPKRVVEQVIKELEKISEIKYEVIIIDDSDDAKSLEILEEVKDKFNIDVIHNKTRKGKVNALNLMAQLFFERDAHYLIHIDADVILGKDLFPRIIGKLNRGYDAITTVNVALPGRSLFEKTVVFFHRLFEYQYVKETPTIPVPGRVGGYRREAATRIFPLPNDICAEDLMIAYKIVEQKLKSCICSDVFVYYKVPTTIHEWISAKIRELSEINYIRREKPSWLVNKLLAGVKIRYSFKGFLNAIRSEPLGFLLSPSIILPYLIAKFKSKSKGRLSPLREMLPTTKNLLMRKMVDEVYWF